MELCHDAAQVQAMLPRVQRRRVFHLHLKIENGFIPDPLALVDACLNPDKPILQQFALRNAGNRSAFAVADLGRSGVHLPGRVADSLAVTDRTQACHHDTIRCTLAASFRIGRRQAPGLFQACIRQQTNLFLMFVVLPDPGPSASPVASAFKYLYIDRSRGLELHVYWPDELPLHELRLWSGHDIQRR